MHKRCNLYSISSMRKAALFIIFERTRKKGPPKKEHKNNRTQKQSHSICRTNRTHRTTTTKAHQHFHSMFICVFTIWTYSKAERDKKKQREITGMQISACVFHRFTLAVAVYFFFVLSSKFLGHSVMKKKILSSLYILCTTEKYAELIAFGMCKHSPKHSGSGVTLNVAPLFFWKTSFLSIAARFC